VLFYTNYDKNRPSTGLDFEYHLMIIRIILYWAILYTGRLKKVSRYHESLLNRIKTRH